MFSPELITGGVVLLLLALLAIRTPVAFALAASGALGIVILQGFSRASASLAAIPFDTTASYSWIVIPLFIFLGMMASNGNIAQDVYYIASRILKWLPGGLGLSTVAACAGFAAISGSSLATAATIGRLSIREMIRHGYDGGFAAGIVAAAGTLGALIPPSLILVVYAIIAKESVAELLAAGIIPGLLSAVLHGAFIVARSSFRSNVETGVPTNAPANRDQEGTSAEVTAPAAAPSTTKSGIQGLILIAIIFLLVMGGIYEGLFTVTESAALGALTCLILVPVHLWLRGDKSGLKTRLWSAATEAASLTSMVFAIVVGASIFTFFLVLAGVPGAFASWVIGLDVAPLMVVFLLLLLMLPLGMFLEPISILLIVVPLAHPAITALGFDGVWFGILTVKMIELSMITPPVGLNVFVVAGSTDDVSVEQAFRGVSWFYLSDVLAMLILLFFPAIVLWLPSVLLG